MVHWLRLSASSAEGEGSIPGHGTKIPHATRYGQKKNFFQLCLRTRQQRLWASLLLFSHSVTSSSLLDCSPPGSTVHGDSPGKNTGVGCLLLLRGSTQPGDWTLVFYMACLHQQAGSLLLAPPGRPLCWRVSTKWKNFQLFCCLLCFLPLFLFVLWNCISWYL